LGKKILRNLDDWFSSKTLKIEVATTNGKNIIKLKMAAATNINKNFSSKIRCLKIVQYHTIYIVLKIFLRNCYE